MNRIKRKKGNKSESEISWYTYIVQEKIEDESAKIELHSFILLDS